MARTWKGWRSITVGARQFRWAVDFHEPAEQFSRSYVQSDESWAPDQLTVRSESNPEYVLFVNWPARCGPVVTPRLVGLCIEVACSRSWLGDEMSVDLDGTKLEI